MSLRDITVHKSKCHSILRKHPWIFSGAIKSKPQDLQEGELVYVHDDSGRRLGFGYYQNNSISIKLLSFGEEKYNPDSFWNILISNAFNLRATLGLIGNSDTNAYRLIHGEADGAPGLIIDIYDDTAVLQCHSQGIYNNIHLIAEALQNIYPNAIRHIYNKSKDTLPSSPSHTLNNYFIVGNKAKVNIIENGICFEINLLDGQKTGFFLDQRENRQLLRKYSKNKNVLNTFSYTGGFSLNALKGEATSVQSIDSSSKALEQLTVNLQINNYSKSAHQSHCLDVIPFLNNLVEDYFDIIVLDPPAFAKNISKRHNAIQAYKRINLAAINKIKKGGLLFTFSCSQVVTEDFFYSTLMAAGIESKRNVQLLHKLHQAPDHPVSIFHPEGSYLKGAVLFIS